jgi:sulfur-oxidizing protein SoxY
MNQLRRTFLKGAALAGTVAVAAAAGLLAPMRLLAAERSKAFDAKGLPDTLKSLGAATVTDSKDITIKAPHVAENGAMIPVEITSTIPGTTANDGEAYVSTRIKMGQTSSIKAIAKAGDKFYTASKEIKVTIGGCGG